jgi:ABC-2 type transport system permease protein
MLNAILVIARARLLIARNTFWRGKLGRKVMLVVALALVGLAAYGAYALMYEAVRVVTSPAFLAELRETAAAQPEANLPTTFQPFLDALPSIALAGASFIVLLTSFGTVLSSLYLSGDIDALLVAPVPMRAVFVVKFFGALLSTYVLLFLLLGPLLLAYGRALGFAPAFYAAAVLALLLLPLLPAGLSTLLVMGVVRVVPARRAREIVGVIGGLFGMLWYVASQFSSRIAPRVANLGMLDRLRRFDNPLLPSAWASRALVGAGQADWGALALYGGLFVGVSLGVFVSCLALAERLYYEGWSNMAIQGGRVRAKPARPQARSAPGGWLGWVSRVLPPESAAIFYKDLRVFPRDLRNIQQFIFPLLIAGVWIVQLLTSAGRTSAGPDDGPDFMQAFGPIASLGISFYICTTLSAALGGTSVSREGRGFWQLKVAPISVWRLLLGKLALAYLPFLTVGTLFVVALTLLQRLGPLDLLRNLSLLWATGLGTSGLSLGLGAAFPRLDWEKPTQQTTARAGCLGSLANLTYVGLALLVAVGLPALSSLFPQFALAFYLGGYAAFFAITAVVLFGILSFAAARLEQMELA